MAQWNPSVEAPSVKKPDPIPHEPSHIFASPVNIRAISVDLDEIFTEIHLVIVKNLFLNP
jgi:hypothetical protein